MTRPIRVLVADDHMIVRTGIRHVLESEAGFEVVGEAATGAEALALTSQLKPDVVVLDISMPGESGLQLAARLRESTPELRVLILSMHDNAEYVLESVRAGAHGYLLKDTAATELRNAIRTVCGGESYFSPPIASRLARGPQGRTRNSRRHTVTADDARARGTPWGSSGEDEQGDGRGARHQSPDGGNPPGEPDAQASDPHGGRAHPICPRSGTHRREPARAMIIFGP